MSPTPERSLSAVTESHAREVLVRLDAELAARRSAAPGSSYVAGLYAKGIDAIARKVGEEAVETVIAAKNPDLPALVGEVADLWFHSLLLLHARGSDSAAVLQELARREGVSGLVEKAARGSGTTAR